ncbi:FecR family protein [Flavobacteriaceae bacterium]|nr:FecR family protein [Flavobacteriaceae bacterium]MDB4591094.1 FecR family protein [Flavobacteriaceae bacterium]
MVKESLNKFDESCVLYLSGQMTNDEQVQFIRAYQDDEEKRKLYYKTKDIWEYYQLTNKSSQVDINAAWDNMVDTKGINFDKVATSNRRYKLRISLNIAVVFIAMISLVTIYTLIPTNQQKQNLTHAFETSIDGKLKLTLSDGSKILVADKTKLDLDENFNKYNRRLRLEGEAHFDIKGDSIHPFLINVGDMKVVVKGTSFNLLHDKEKKQLLLSLEEGRVEIIDGETSFTLVDGDYLKLNTETKQKSITKTIPEVVEKNNNHFRFINMPLGKLCFHIERIYAYEVVVNDPDLLDLNFTGVLKRERGIHHLMYLLSITNRVRYTIKGNKVYINSAN